jgi:periplasmic divalent cation tolerance protein
MVKGTHSYDVPEIIALPIISGSEDYLKWLDSACQ